MVCDCCGKNKKLFETFARIKTDTIELNLCVKCNDLMYKIRDAYNEDDEDTFEKCNDTINKHCEKSKPKFLKWKNEFIENMKKSKRDNEEDDDKKSSV